MGNVSRTVNDNPAFDLGDLTAETEQRTFEPQTPVMATPAAAAAGAGVAVTAAVGGFAAEEAADG